MPFGRTNGFEWSESGLKTPSCRIVNSECREGGDRLIKLPDAVKRHLARINMGFEDRYGHRIGGSQRRVLDAWIRQVSAGCFRD